MAWNIYAKDQEVKEVYREQDEELAEYKERRLADLAKQLHLYDSDDFAFFLSYLDSMKVAIEKEAILETDPVKHGECRGRWGVISHLLAIPEAARLEHEALKSELAELRPE